MRLVVFIPFTRKPQESETRGSINSISRERARSAAAVSIVHNAIHSAAWEAEMFTYDRTTICYAIKYRGGGRRIARKLRADWYLSVAFLCASFPLCVFLLVDRCSVLSRGPG